MVFEKYHYAGQTLPSLGMPFTKQAYLEYGKILPVLQAGFSTSLENANAPKLMFRESFLSIFQINRYHFPI